MSGGDGQTINTISFLKQTSKKNLSTGFLVFNWSRHTSAVDPAWKGCLDFEIRARQTNPEKFAGDWLSAVPGPITQTQGGRDGGQGPTCHGAGTTTLNLTVGKLPDRSPSTEETNSF